jgi:DNA-binding CsgD family transcriptional regulator
LKKVRVFSNVVRGEKEDKRDEKRIDQSFFVFCEKTTGVAQFRTGSAGESEFSLDRLAGLFAMQCLVRGYEPNDFVVLVPAEKEIAGKLVSRAKDLLEEGRAVAGPACLSPRQKEILHSVLCNRANKEIASRLNITVRTVKFHISSLLSKFGVDNRTDLARRAAGLLRPAVLDGGNVWPPLAAGTEPARVAVGHGQLRPGPVNADFRAEPKSRSVRFAGRVATA